MEHNDVIEIDLLKLIQALLKKAWLIILVAVIAAGAMFMHTKANYKPSYYAFSTLYVQGSDGDLTYSSADAATRIKTLNAFKNTQTVVDEVNQMTGLNLDRETLSQMVVLGSMNGGELLAVSVTCPDPEKSILIVNAVSEILPKYAEMLHGEDSLVIFEKASTATVEGDGPNGAKKAVVAAVLGACLVCVVVVAKEFYLDWKAHTAKNR